MSKEAAFTMRQTFDALLQYIRQTVFAQVNTAMIDLYLWMGKAISEKVQQEGWGKGVVEELTRHIARRAPEFRIKTFGG